MQINTIEGEHLVGVVTIQIEAILEVDKINMTCSEHLEVHAYYLEHLLVVCLDRIPVLNAASNVLGDI